MAASSLRYLTVEEPHDKSCGILQKHIIEYPSRFIPVEIYASLVASADHHGIPYHHNFSNPLLFRCQESPSNSASLPPCGGHVGNMCRAVIRAAQPPICVATPGKVSPTFNEDENAQGDDRIVWNLFG